MNTAHATALSADAASRDKLPWFPLGVLAAMGFLLVATETMPAGLLPVIAAGLHTSEGTVGQLISAYALGTVVITVPAITLTRGFRRKPLLMWGIVALVLANTVTALTGDVTISLVARFVAGACSGTIWGMLAVYGRSISPVRYGGRSLAIVSTGAPVGFAFGTPLGSWLGLTFDWRWSFGGLSIVAVLILVLVGAFVPDVAGQARATRTSARQVLRTPGVAIVLAVIAAWMLAHNTIYTYISPYLRATGTGITPDLMLLVYGIAAIVGVVLTGVLIDRHPRPLLHASVTLFVIAGAIMLVGHATAVAVLISSVLWGVTFGGASAQLQAALTSVGGRDADVANSFLPVAFNVAIFAAGLLGAGLLVSFDGLVLAVVMVVLGLVALGLTFYGRRSAF
jgi:predicted MFS family arabinose efflux permease